MRNLSQYPVTHQEKLAALDWAIAKYGQEAAVGGVHGVALREIRKDLEGCLTYPPNQF